MDNHLRINMLRRLLLVTVLPLAFGLFSCTSVLRTEESPAALLPPSVFRAGIAETKTTLSDGSKVFWQPEDRLTIHDGSSTAILENGLTASSASADFTVASGSVDEDASTFMALYPETALHTWDTGDDNDFVYLIPASQQAVPGDIASGCDIMAARSATRSLTFNHLLSALKFTIGEDSPYITQISLTAAVNITGKYTYKFASGSEYKANGTKVITLSRGDGGVFPVGDYYLMFPARNYKAALTVTFTDDMGSTDTRSIPAGKTSVAGSIYPMGTIGGLSLHVPFDTNTKSASGLDASGITAAEAFRGAALSAGKTNSVWINSSAYTSYTDKAVLAARLSLLGFRSVYLSPGAAKINTKADDLKEFIFECTRYRIKVYYSALDDRSILANYNSAAVDRLVAYNEAVSPSQQFTGLAADIEPQSCTAGNVPDGLAYTWSGSSYGVGGDNDRLLAITLDRLDAARDGLKPAGLELGEAVHFNFQIYQNSGQLSNGDAPDFLSRCDFLTVMSYLTDKESIWEKAEPTLTASDRGGAVSVAVSTKNGGSGSLYSGGWSNLLDVLDYLRTCGESNPGFRGLDIFGFADFMALFGADPV